jgi:PAS domain S-box-containing protein
VIGLGVYRLATEVERDRAQAHLDLRVAAAALAIERELAAGLEVLYALRPLFEAGVPVPHERFTAVAEPFLARHPSLQALEWVPCIAHGSRHAHEQDRREDGFDGYTITERGVTGEVVVAGDREWYYPVAFVTPIGGNEPAIGFDLGSDTLRREAIDRAAATGEIALSDPVTLVQDTVSANGVLAPLAVFRGASEIAEAGGADPRGFVLAVLRLDRLLAHAQLGPGGEALTGILFELIDGDGGFLAVHGSPDGRQDQPLSGISAERPIEAGGQRWHLVAFPTAEYLKSLQTRQPLLLGVIAVVAWELLMVLVAILGKQSRNRLERRHAHLMQNILESLTEGVIVADTSGKILAANSAANAISNNWFADVPPSAWPETYGLFRPGTETLFPPDELPLARAISGEATGGVEVLVHNPQVPDGTFMSVSGAPLLSESGAIRGGVVVFRDISDRKRAEERLQRLSSAVEQTADSVLITDQQGNIEYVNPAFEATTGYSSAEVLGRNPNILKSGVQGSGFYRDLWETILRGEPHRGTIVNRKKNGDLYYAEQTITAIKDRNGSITHFVSVLKDMTERRKLQEQEIEMELAAEIQQELLPDEMPSIPGFEVLGRNRPARHVGGDYFGFHQLDDERWALVLGDVSGKGAPAALLVSTLDSALRVLLDHMGVSPELLDRLNLHVFESSAAEKFITMIVAEVEPREGVLTYLNAGHNPGLWLRSDGTVEHLDPGGFPVGMFPDGEFESGRLQLGGGDLLCFYSDGITEAAAPDEEEFEIERLTDVLDRHRDRPLDEILEAVYRAVAEFADGQPQGDDQTVVLLRRSVSE